ncbi:ABC transporter permease [Prosthecomicrobium sp. N25]|uniref:ABC transporter permease n=1 Tax=Prosthecomicrobium sp. N25 TaxID=3129254 RepID=UPI0030781E75
MRWWRHPSLLVGGCLAGALVLVALVALVWTPFDPAQMAMGRRLQGPSAAHWLGTDPFGRDVLSKLMRGAVNSLRVGLLAVGLGLAAGVALGALAAARAGSLLDEAVMRTADFTFAFPAVLTAIMITALAGPGALNAILAIAIFNVPVFARLARGAALQVWSRDFVLAARAAGLTGLAITTRHVVPNIAGLVVVQATIQFALAILAEAGLSYLGLGTQPPEPSWGRMLNEAQTFLQTQPLLAVFPGVAIAAAVLGFNLLGDGLRDLIDPKSRRART